MFGTLRPSLCQLPPEQSASYRRMYCGTCQSLGEHYGHLTRPLLSFDIVLLSSIVEALQAQPGEADSCRCPLLPVVHRPTLSPSSPAMKLAAAVQVVLADQWLADHAQDGRTAGKLGRPLLRKRAHKARNDLAALGIEQTAFAGLAARQLDIERRGRVFADAAEPTATVLESLFGQIGRLPGATDTARERAGELAQLGRHLGTAIYALDALEDLKDDVADGQFNPCIDESGRISSAALGQVSEALECALTEIRSLVAAIPWHRHRDIIGNILRRQFPARCRRAISAARELAATQPAPRGWLARTPLTLPVRLPVRLLLSLLTAMAVAWATFARQARAAVRRHERATMCEVDEADVRACPVTPTLAPAGGGGRSRRFARVDDEDDNNAAGPAAGPSDRDAGLGSGGLVLDPSVIAATNPPQPGHGDGQTLGPEPATAPAPNSTGPEYIPSADPYQQAQAERPARKGKRRRRKKQRDDKMDGADWCDTICCGLECADCACCCLTSEGACGDGASCCDSGCCDCCDSGCCDCCSCDCSI